MSSVSLSPLARYEVPLLVAGGSPSLTHLGACANVLGPYRVLDKLREGGPPPLSVRRTRELRRDLVRLRESVATARPRRSSKGIEFERRRAVAHRSDAW